MHAGPETTALDWYGPEADSLRIMISKVVGGEDSMQVECGAGLAEDDIYPLRLILRPLQYFSACK